MFLDCTGQGDGSRQVLSKTRFSIDLGQQVAVTMKRKVVEIEFFNSPIRQGSPLALCRSDLKLDTHVDEKEGRVFRMVLMQKAAHSIMARF